jgi:hypothetical protein
MKFTRFKNIPKIPVIHKAKPENFWLKAICLSN